MNNDYAIQAICYTITLCSAIWAAAWILVTAIQTRGNNDK
jgi:hypothetical protein